VNHNGCMLRFTMRDKLPTATVTFNKTFHRWQLFGSMLACVLNARVWRTVKF